MLHGHFVDPIFLDIHHPVPTFHLPIRTGLIQLTRNRSITESLKPKVVGLWNLIVDDIKEHANADESDNTCEIAFKYINKMNEIDVRADIFRYPINNVLEVYFQEARKLDVENVFDLFMELLKFLDSVTFMMSVQNEWKAEMEYELYQQYGEDFH